MIVLDSDVLIDLLRKHPPAMAWFDALQEDEELMVSGYVVMELIQGCRNKSGRTRWSPDASLPRMGWYGSLKRIAIGRWLCSPRTASAAVQDCWMC